MSDTRSKTKVESRASDFDDAFNMLSIPFGLGGLMETALIGIMLLCMHQTPAFNIGIIASVSLVLGRFGIMWSQQHLLRKDDWMYYPYRVGDIKLTKFVIHMLVLVFGLGGLMVSIVHLYVAASNSATNIAMVVYFSGLLVGNYLLAKHIRQWLPKQ